MKIKVFTLFIFIFCIFILTACVNSKQPNNNREEDTVMESNTNTPASVNTDVESVAVTPAADHTPAPVENWQWTDVELNGMGWITGIVVQAGLNKRPKFDKKEKR